MYFYCNVVSHETVNVHLRNKPEWLFERNPLGQVPIIEYQGYAVYESAICNEFLEDAFPVPALYPKSAFKRAEARLQMKLSETKVNL